MRSAIVLICAGSTSPGASRNWIWANVILPSGETGAPLANGSPTASTSGDFAISARTASICARLSSTRPWSTAKTTLAVSPDCAGNFSLSRSYVRWDSVPGRLKLLTNSPAVVVHRPMETTKAATQRPMTVRRRSWHQAASERMTAKLRRPAPRSDRVTRTSHPGGARSVLLDTGGGRQPIRDFAGARRRPSHTSASAPTASAGATIATTPGQPRASHPSPGTKPASAPAA